MLKRATTKCYLVPIQSFSDIITNSSSETYIVDTSYTAEALKEVLKEIHKQHEDEEYYSGECCGIEVYDFREYCKRNYEYSEESSEEYMSIIYEIPLSVIRECLIVRVDYGFHYVDEFLNKNFKCISSDHERDKDEKGRVIKY